MKFSVSTWIYAIKIYLACIISFVISCWMGLDQNYWTILTCCVLMNPYSGMTRAKSVHRMIGTLAGGGGALFYASFLANAPVLMLIVLGITGGAGFAMALLDRTPRSYGYRIFSVTLMLVALPSVGNPLHIFDTTVARVFEIGLAVLCTTLVDAVIFPKSMRPIVLKKIDIWLKDTDAWTRQAFEGHIQGEATNHDRLKALADISAMTAMAGQLSHDHMMNKAERGVVYAIQQRLLKMVPLLSSIAHNLSDADLQIRKGLSRSLLDRFDRLQFLPHTLSDKEWTFQEMEQSQDKTDAGTSWNDLVRKDLITLSQNILVLWSQILQLRTSLDKKITLSSTLAQETRKVRYFPLRPDTYLSLRIFCGFILTYALLCFIWWITGWAQMPRAILLASVTVGFFGATENTILAVGKLARFLLIIMLLTWIFCFFIFPLTRDFLSFALAMGLFIIPIGAWSAQNVMGRLILALGVSTMNLQNGFVPMGFDTFIAEFAANFLGVFAAFSCLGMVRSLTTDHTLNRLLKRGRQDLQNLTEQADKKGSDKYVLNGLNRISLYAARMASQGQTWRSDRIMSCLIAGMTIGDLRYHGDQSDTKIRQAIQVLLELLKKDLFAPVWPQTLRLTIDQALNAVWYGNIQTTETPILRSLVRLRLALFNEVPAWRPQR
nr:FUSC family protein [uncultured Desulfobacter sp.]